MPKCPSNVCVCSILTVWIFISVCSLIVATTMYLRPFMKVIRYRQSTCRLESFFFTTQYVCSCGDRCVSTYPCYLAHVSINYTAESTWVVTLYDNDDQQATVLDSEMEERERCSIRVCQADSLQNRDAVEAFRNKYGRTGLEMICFYDPWNIRSGAVLNITIPGWEALHSVAWPSLSIFLAILSCAIFCRRCRSKELEKENAKGSDVTETKPLDLSTSTSQDINNYVSAARAILATKKRKQRSIRNLWMMQQNT